MIDFSQDRPPITSDERIKALRSLARIEKEMGYLDERVSEAELPAPSFDGETYEAEAPDTLDLTVHAQYAINAFTRMLDPAMDYRFHGNAHFLRRPPSLALSPSFECTAKHLESLPLMRLMSGSTFNMGIDNKFMQSRLHLAAKDGFFYSPWSKAAWIHGHLGGAPVGDDIVTRTRQPFTSIWEEGRTVLALCMWYQIDGNPLWKELIEKKIDRMSEVAAWDGDTCYFARRWYVLGDRGPVKEPRPSGQWALFDLMFCPAGCMLYHRLTGYEPALKLAGGLIRRALQDRATYGEQGQWLTSHFHTNTGALHTILAYATATDDAELLEFARRGYEFGKALGEPLTGYYPEHVTGADFGDYDVAKWGIHKTCETCEVADMLVLAVRLARAGFDEYWEDVERCVRNQFVENQITRTDWIERLSQEIKPAEHETMAQQLWEDERDAVERTVGSWAGWATANDGQHRTLMQCCIGNAGRSMYYAWDSIVTREDDCVRVNLLLNRASKWVDVDSHLPYEGKVVVRIKEAPRVAVRIPSWTDRGQVACMVNGARHDFVRAGSYVDVGGLRCGDRLTVEFPIRERTVFREIGDGAYELQIRGNTVVGVAPKGTIYPLYERGHMRQDRAPMKRVVRFVPKDMPAW